MGCPYLATGERFSCIASPVAYLQSIFELNAYCNTTHQEQCHFFIHRTSNTEFDLPDHRFWSLGSFR